MVKKKAKAIVTVPDGSGGMMPLQDQRFEGGEWPIHFEVPVVEADTWFNYFRDALAKRGWHGGSIGQLGAKENSGSITVNAGVLTSRN